MPVVLSFHYGYDEFSIGENWWNQEQRSEFENTILAKYNVILMSTGHLHFYPNELYTIPVNVGKKTIGLLPTCTCGGNNEIEWVQ